ncbi:MAG: YbjN domain-containing protein [Candidatus Latescibacterota bacterium]|jgi:hypothetical protein
MASKVVFDDIVGFLRKNGWEFGIGSSQAVSLSFEGEHSVYSAYIFYPMEKEIILMYAEYPFRVPETRREEFFELVSRINWGLLFTTCEYNPETGKVRFRGTMLTDGAPFYSEQFATLLAIIWSTIDRYEPSFRAVLNGEQTVKEALS